MADCRVVIAEPSAVVAEGLRSILERQSDIAVVAVMNDLANAARLVTLAPDVVIVNPSLVDTRSRSNIRGDFPQLDGSVFMAVAWGLWDEELLRRFDGVISVWDGAPQIVRKIRAAVEQSAGQAGSVSYDLSEREREILVAVARGMTNKEIADLYSISIYTVISHRKNITRKTGIKSVSGLTVYAMLNNMIDGSEM